MLRRLVPAFLVIAVTACAPPVDPADANRKAKLVGSWRFEYKDEFDRAVQGTVRLSDDGKFFAVKMVKDEQAPKESRRSGPWYVTAGLFKLNTQVADGAPLETMQQSFFTCKVTEFYPGQFSCSDELAKKNYRYTRVSNAS